MELYQIAILLIALLILNRTCTWLCLSGLFMIMCIASFIEDLKEKLTKE